MGIHYTRSIRLRHHVVDAGIGLAIGVPLAVAGWLVTLWVGVR